MKTTIEISDALLARAKARAARDGTTLRALVEEGLTKVLQDRKQDAEFRLRKSSFKGRGVQDRARGFDWERMRNLAYEGRGT